MARIADAELERLKAVPLAGLIEASGVTLARQGADLAGLCPFHAEDTPSLKVTPGKNLWHCFGCGAGGGPIDWLMKRRGVSFRHAVELLREDAGLAETTADPATAAKRSTVRVLESPVSLDEDDAAVLGRVAAYYHATLKRTPAALAYLERRGIGSAEAIDTFKPGFADRTLGLRLPDKRRKEGAELRARLERLGVFRESGHEHFTGSLVVPVFDAQGQVAGMYGRKINDNLRAGTPLHLYLPGPHRGVWNLAGIAASGGEVIVCEALIDALTFWCAGHRNVTASYGVDGFTDEHLAVFRQHEIRRVKIAYDRDEAGERGAAKLAAQLQAAGIASWRVEFPKGLDANAYALKVTPAEKSLGMLLRTARWLGPGEPPAPESVPAESAAKEESPGTELDASAPNDDAASLLAAALPEASPRQRPEVTAGEREVTLRFGPRRWRVRGIERAQAADTLRVNLMAATETAFHVDTLDLYSAKARAGFIEQAATELGMTAAAIKAELGQVLLELETLAAERARQSAAPEPTPAEAMTEEDREAALDLLRTPDLLDRIVADFEACGLIGEATNKLVGYLATVSRKLAAPLAVLVQSSSAAGKSSLMDAVLAFVPEEERVRYSAITGQALFYMGRGDLKHRILAICEEEGASRAAYALKLLQSDGSLTIASTGKDPETGALITQDYRVDGPVMIFLTTTAIDIDEELLNRCLVLSVDEGRAQTEAIHRLQRQRRTLEGLLAREAKAATLALHQNAQRLLRPLAVVNPFADRLTFLSDRTRTRRDHEKYLTLIDAIALLHQHQRPVRRAPGSDLAYVEVTAADIAQANRLTHEVLGRSLDALPPQTRRLLGLIATMVAERATAQASTRGDIRFTRRELREATGWGDTQLKLHLARLAELEYLLVHRAERGQGQVYELLYDGDGGAAPHLSGLIDPQVLADGGYDAQRSGLLASRSGATNDRSPVGRPPAGGQSAHGRTETAAKEEAGSMAYRDLTAKQPESPIPPPRRVNGSQPHLPVTTALPLAALPG
jgi:DNA primase